MIEVKMIFFVVLFFSLFLRNEKLEAEAKSATEKFEEVSSCFVSIMSHLFVLF